MIPNVKILFSEWGKKYVTKWRHHIMTLHWRWCVCVHSCTSTCIWSFRVCMLLHVHDVWVGDGVSLSCFLSYVFVKLSQYVTFKSAICMLAVWESIKAQSVFDDNKKKITLADKPIPIFFHSCWLIVVNSRCKPSMYQSSLNLETVF